VAGITREALFLKWNSGATKKCFYVMQTEYGGGTETKPASYRRNLDGRLLRVAGTSYRIWRGTVWVTTSPSGTENDGSEDISVGSDDDLKSAHDATDLQMKSFEDSSYITVEWMGDWTYEPMDPLGTHKSVVVYLEQKLDS
jgi:hypothetical protein